MLGCCDGFLVPKLRSPRTVLKCDQPKSNGGMSTRFCLEIHFCDKHLGVFGVRGFIEEILNGFHIHPLERWCLLIPGTCECPLFLAVLALQNNGIFSSQNKGHLGSRYIYIIFVFVTASETPNHEEVNKSNLGIWGFFGLSPFPSHSHRQDYYFFTSGDSYKPSFASITEKGSHPWNVLP